VARFLSLEWAEEFNAALDGVVLPEPGPDAGLAAADGQFTVVEEVRATPDGDVSLVLRADQGTLRLALGPVGVEGGPAADVPAPDVTIKISYEDAASLSRGELSPAEALSAGRIRVKGDLSVLVAAQEMLAGARTATRALDTSTTY
jgi:putative sterol carrier protein